MAKYANLKYALEFNKVTITLAIAGMAAAIEAGSHFGQFWRKVVYTLSVLMLFISVLEGLMVLGRASRLADNADYSPKLARLGSHHLWSLGIGGTPVAIGALYRIWI
jgi:hypothetical protein